MFQFSLQNFDDSDIFCTLFSQFIKKLKKRPIFLCIGTKKSENDCFGPNFGTLLKRNARFFVYGSLKREVNGLNYIDVYNFIRKKHKDSPIIVIDNALIKNSNETILIFKDEGTFPRAIDNQSFIVGDASILINGFEYNRHENFNKLYKIILTAIKKSDFHFE